MKHVVFLLLVIFSANTFGGNPKIILKLDDYKVQRGSCRGIEVLTYLKEKNVKASFGVIASYCDQTSKAVFNDLLNARNQRGEKLFEVWNHGYDHIKPEFKETAFEYQKQHFLKADSLICSNLGLQPTTFGAPYNANDSNTLKVLALIPRYKTLFFSQVAPPSGSGVLNLTNRVNLEIKTGVPDSAAFVTAYLASKEKLSGYIVLQAHPPHFTPDAFVQFQKVIEFLLREGCEFVLPDDYYRSLNRKLPSKH